MFIYMYAKEGKEFREKRIEDVLKGRCPEGTEDHDITTPASLAQDRK